jgi:hypothetical protein
LGLVVGIVVLTVVLAYSLLVFAIV